MICKMSRFYYLKYIITPFVGVLLFSTIAFIQFSRFEQLNALTNDIQSKEYYLREELKIKSSLSLLRRLPTLGFDNLIADWTFLRFLQYFGDQEARSQTGYQVNPDFFEVIVDRDPNFIKMYPYLSSTVTLYSGQPQKTISLIRKGGTGSLTGDKTTQTLA